MKVVKALLYNDKLFLKSRDFYEFILENVFEGESPSNFTLNYVSVCFTNKLNTISGISVAWVVIDSETEQLLSEKSWIKWTDGKDKTFREFVVNQGVDFTKEELWRWAVDYVVTYDLPRSKLKKLTDDILRESFDVGRKRGVLVYRLPV